MGNWNNLAAYPPPEFKELPPEDVLRWLKQANDFIRKFTVNNISPKPENREPCLPAGRVNSPVFRTQK